MDESPEVMASPLLGRHMCPDAGSATSIGGNILSRQNLIFSADGRMNPDGTLGPAWGFVYQGIFIWNPRLSSCGRFTVDPLKTYGLSEYEVTLLANLNAAF